MKTICIKTNNFKSLNYLLENLKNLELDNVYFSCHKFKSYNNIIIHYKGNNLELFLSSISNILVFLVLDIYENNIISKILHHDYFYFDNIEKKQILDKTKNIYYEDIENFTKKENLLFNTFYHFLKENNKLYLKGFITFRLKKYIAELEKTVDNAINGYLIEKEYSEFVSLLKLYVNTEESKIDEVHLIYNTEKPVLLDKEKNIIKTDINLLNAKYLSDITFSSLDMVLNTLLNLVPQKIYLHLMDQEIDEFINTLKLIFEKRVYICRDCNICRIYKSSLLKKTNPN